MILDVAIRISLPADCYPATTVDPLKPTFPSTLPRTTPMPSSLLSRLLRIPSLLSLTPLRHPHPSHPHLRSISTTPQMPTRPSRHAAAPAPAPGSVYCHTCGRVICDSPFSPSLSLFPVATPRLLQFLDPLAIRKSLIDSHDNSSAQTPAHPHLFAADAANAAEILQRCVPALSTAGGDGGRGGEDRGGVREAVG